VTPSPTCDATRTLITGARGMLGSDLMRAFASQNPAGLSSADMDITNRDAVRTVLHEKRPQWVIHAAGMTHVDGCELDPESAYRVNGLGSRNLALACEEVGATLLYVSTDYVFDGEKSEPYTEFDPTHPLSVYGKSKLAGEMFVREFCRRHCIVRTSWLFGKNGKNFVQTVLRLAAGGDDLRIVSDQVGSPTYTWHLAQKIGEIVTSGRLGIYHITNSGHCSWFELAQATLRSRQHSARVVPITTAEYPTPARRPRSSILRNYILELEGITLLPPWQQALSEYLAQCHG